MSTTTVPNNEAPQNSTSSSEISAPQTIAPHFKSNSDRSKPGKYYHSKHSTAFHYHNLPTFQREAQHHHEHQQQQHQQQQVQQPLPQESLPTPSSSSHYNSSHKHHSHHRPHSRERFHQQQQQPWQQQQEHEQHPQHQQQQQELPVPQSSNNSAHYKKQPRYAPRHEEGFKQPFHSSHSSHHENASSSASSSYKSASGSTAPYNVKSTEDFANVQKMYKSAGIIPYAVHEGKMYILIGLEYRALDSQATWNEFGGKKDIDDRDSIETAAREFCEETLAAFFPPTESAHRTGSERFTVAKRFIESKLRAPFTSNSKSYYVPAGKYHLFTCQVPYVTTHQIVEYQKANKSTHDISCGGEKTKFEWVEAVGFLEHFKKMKTPAAEQYQSYELGKFFVKLLAASHRHLEETALAVEFENAMKI